MAVGGGRENNTTISQWKDKLRLRKAPTMVLHCRDHVLLGKLVVLLLTCHRFHQFMSRFVNVASRGDLLTKEEELAFDSGQEEDLGVVGVIGS